MFGKAGHLCAWCFDLLELNGYREKKRAYHHKMKVLSLVDRRTGQARSMVVDDLKPTTIAPILRENMSREARLATDEAGHYLHIGKEFADHGVVRHSKEEYVVGEVHTNTIEGYFSVFKAIRQKMEDSFRLA